MSNLIKQARSEGKAKVVHISAVIDPHLDSLKNSGMDSDAIEQTLNEKIDETKREANRLIKEAETKAAEIRQQIARDEETAEQKRAEAYEKKIKEGYAAGFSKGTKAAKEHYDSLIDQGNQFVEQTKSFLNDSIKEAQPEILKLSIAVAEKIIGTSLALDEYKWFALVAKAVREVRDQETIKITVAPKHFDHLNQNRWEFDKIVQDAKVYVYADSDFSDEACTIETSFGKIDAGVDSQLQVIKEKLAELMEEKG
ncbi:flagellar assembly protein FliH [Sporolactobacillus shoreicorticis]|uniref:Flagellar assembly protein FliH n=1 Tax=Sporolactobacillus shoreicorticis TaxID=1923877 RepID=A0ABW5S9P1_9BACL|nr:flagellar assembly protein FliH [Sporolactobacillus shoreicorticis]MCO7125998.1 flagellar assembly protein FliH [Sporolactobacillus shoreicorticis]